MSFFTEFVRIQNIFLIIRYNINSEDSLVLFDNAPTIVETGRINAFILFKFKESMEYFGYVMFYLGFYDESNNAYLYEKMIMVSNFDFINF